MKDESEGKIINKFVGLKSKMYFMRNTDRKESYTAKGVNIAIECHEFKETLFKKYIYFDTKWEEFKAKNIKWEHRKSTKIIVMFWW